MLSIAMRVIGMTVCLRLDGKNGCEYPKDTDTRYYYTDKITFSRLDASRRGRLFYVGHRLDVASGGGEYSSRHSSHRAVFAVMDIKTQEFRPSVDELILLVSWMLAGMQYQGSAKMRRKQKKDEAVRLHMIFPVCPLAHGLLSITFTNSVGPCLLFYAASSGSSTFWLL